MELIRKSDALHAVLHNTGDAAVAAVQEIESILVPDDFVDYAKRMSYLSDYEKVRKEQANDVR